MRDHQRAERSLAVGVSGSQVVTGEWVEVHGVGRVSKIVGLGSEGTKSAGTRGVRETAAPRRGGLGGGSPAKTAPP